MNTLQRTVRPAALLLVLIGALGGAGANADEPDRAPDWERDYARALELTDTGPAPAALAAWDRLLQDFPESPDARLGRGLVLMRLDRVAEARAEFLAVTRPYPEYLDAWLFLGDTYWRQGDVDAAERAWRQLADRNPDYPGLTGRLARLPERAAADAASTAGDGAYSGSTPARERTLRAGHTQSRFSGGRDSWSGQQVALQAPVAASTLEASVSRTRRFTDTDFSIGLAGWMPRAPWLFHAALTGTPSADITPRTDALLEVTRNIAAGWEASAGARHLHYPDNRIDIAMLGAARYWDRWYARARVGRTSSQASGTGFVSLNLRRYHAADSYVELYGGLAKEEIQVAPGRFVAGDNDSIGLRVQHRLDRRNSIGLGVTRTIEETGPRGWHASAEYAWHW